MSIMSCTYASKILGEEITLMITMPEKSRDEILPFTAVILLPDTAMESSHFMRKEPLERYGRGQNPIATVSLPGRVAMYPPAMLQAFLIDELSSILGQFPLRISALYAQSRSAKCLTEIEEAIKDCYINVKLNAVNETLQSFLEDFRLYLCSQRK